MKNSGLIKLFQRNNFLKNKLLSLASQYLLTNRNDANYFVKVISAGPNNIYAGKVPKFKFIPDEENKYDWIKNLNINTVIDVGAWEGGSAWRFNSLFPKAKIYSFEPLKDCYMKLNLLAKKIPNLTTFNFALGEKNEKMQINRSEFSPSSSLLKMHQTHKETFPFSSGERVEEIDVRTFDSFNREIDFVDNVLLKIDVQGFEDNVLKGALETLNKVKIIIIELSFVELYAGQPKFGAIYNMLLNHNFLYAGSWSQSYKPQDGQILQQDAIFIRKD